MDKLCDAYSDVNNKINEVEVLRQWEDSHTYRHEFLFVKQSAIAIYEKLEVLKNEYAITLVGASITINQFKFVTLNACCHYCNCRSNWILYASIVNLSQMRRCILQEMFGINSISIGL